MSFGSRITASSFAAMFQGARRARNRLGWAVTAIILGGVGLGGPVLSGLAHGQTPPPAPPAKAHRASPASSLPAAAPPVAAGGRHSLDKTDVDAWLDGFFPYALQRGDVAGAVVAVVKDGAVLTQRGYGYADVKKQAAMDPATTMMRVGSVSKLITWTAAMQQVEAGKLDLDADVNRYLDFKIPPYRGKPVTLRNLMTHSGGFEESVRKLDQVGVPQQDLGAMPRQWIPTRIFAPGEVPAYSNYGAALTGYLVQRVSGETFTDYVERHIFAPLRLHHASFAQPLPPALQRFAATGYENASTPGRPFEIMALWPSGSLSISAADMARFMIAHLDNGAPLLKPATAQLMHAPQPSLLPRISHMALGFYTQDENGHRVIAHGGDLRFQHSNVWLFLDDHVGLFVSMNSLGHDAAVGAIRGLLFKQFADRYFPGPEPTGHVDEATARRHAALIAGTYISSRRPDSSFLFTMAMLGQQRVVATKTGTIRLVPDSTVGGGQREWAEIAPWLWRASDNGALLEARVVDGRVERFSTNAVSTELPVRWTINRNWLFPTLQAAFAVVLLTALSWPVAAIARRRLRVAFPLTGEAAMRYRAVRAVSWAAVLVTVGWALTLLLGLADYALLNGKLDAVVTLLQLLTPLIFLLLLGLAAWNLRDAWLLQRGWFSRLWAVLLVAAAIFAWWGAFAFHLIGFGHDY